MKFSNVLIETRTVLNEAYLNTIIRNLDANPRFSMAAVPPGPILVSPNNKVPAKKSDISRQANKDFVRLNSDQIKSLENLIAARNNQDTDVDSAVRRYKDVARNVSPARA